MLHRYDIMYTLDLKLIVDIYITDILDMQVASMYFLYKKIQNKN